MLLSRRKTSQQCNFSINKNADIDSVGRLKEISTKTIQISSVMKEEEKELRGKKSSFEAEAVKHAKRRNI